MKNLLKIIFSVSILFISIDICAQTTWIKTLQKNGYWSGYIHRDSTTIGPYDICVTPNGMIISLVQVNQDHEEVLMAMDSLGNILWSNPITHVATLHYEYAYSLNATQDNGCVYVFRYWSPSSGGYDVINKVDSAGHHQWSSTYNWWIPSPAPSSFYCLPTLNNTYLLRTNDTLIETDLQLNPLAMRHNINGSIFTLPDSDFIHLDTSYIFRENISGTQKWHTYSAGITTLSTNLVNTYAGDGSNVIKINSNDGHLYWTKPISCKNIIATSDSGFITLRNDSNGHTEIVKYDSSGVMQWSKSHFMPRFGYSVLAESKDQSYITGGCWENILCDLPDNNYSPFMVKINRDGAGTIDSSNFYFWGNANDNNIFSFADDAVYIAAAFNKTGPARDPLLQNPFEEESCYSANWNDSFPVGLNYKYSDYDGNGIIDTMDIHALSISLSRMVTPHWKKPMLNSNLPMIKFIFENDTVSLSDTIKVDVVLGSQTEVIDSIYGISFDLELYNVYSNGFYANYSLKPTALGDTAINLYSRFTSSTLSEPYISMVLCRTDNINAFLSGDTIASFQFVLSSNAFFTNPVALLSSFSAITVGGFPISLQEVNDTIALFSTTGIKNQNYSWLSVFPQPANATVIFRSEKIDNVKVKIRNSLGQMMNVFEMTNENNFLNVSEYPEGIYYYEAQSKEKSCNGKFIVSH